MSTLKNMLLELSKQRQNHPKIISKFLKMMSVPKKLSQNSQNHTCNILQQKFYELRLDYHQITVKLLT